jgi:hypothetical protein
VSNSPLKTVLSQNVPHAKKENHSKIIESFHLIPKIMFHLSIMSISNVLALQGLNYKNAVKELQFTWVPLSRVLFLASEYVSKQVRVVPSINRPTRVNPSVFW